MKPERTLFGFHPVVSRLRAAPKTILEIFVDASRDDARMRELVASAEAAGVRVLRVDAKRLDGFHGGHGGVVARVEAATPGKSLDELLEVLDHPPLLLVLDGVTDPHNLGACLRVADAAGADAVVAPKDRACGLNATVSKVASGAAEVIPYFMVTNLARTLDELKERDIWVVGTDERAEQTLYEADLPRAIAWVLGAEGEGMRRLTRERCDQLIRIPMSGSVASLNVSVASGVCLFESRRRLLAG